MNRPLFFWLVCLGLLAGCSKPTVLERIHQEKTLHLVTLNGPLTYFEGRNGPEGYQFELAQQFADHLGVELRVRVVNDLEQVYSVVARGYTQLAAVGVTRRAVEKQHPDFGFTRSILEVRPLVLSRQGQKRPRKPEDLAGLRIGVLDHTIQAQLLRSLGEQYPSIAFSRLDDISAQELIGLVENQKLDIAVVNSTEFAVNNALFPQVQVAFELAEEAPVTWLTPPGQDKSLIEEVNRFLDTAEKTGVLTSLEERYYSHTGQLDYVGARTFQKHIQNRLHKFKDLFIKAGIDYELDWRLLAAMGYQESHWRPNAVSPTGVRGLMMLTLPTARDLGISNRLDAAQSIDGGARYFSQILARLPESIEEPHRSWMALAAYNVGFGHLQDARQLTRKQGMNPNIWEDVMQHLPLLEKKYWYQQTRYGYARGREPVHYVQNIRQYYDVLAWSFPEKTEQDTAQDHDAQIPAPPVEIPEPFLTVPPTL